MTTQTYPIFDAHCDVLFQMYKDPTYRFHQGEQMHVTYPQLVEAGAKVQCFAIFVPHDVHPHDRFQIALQMVDDFYEKVLRPCPNLKLVRSKGDIESLQDHEIGAILTLEGCEPIEEDLLKLTTLFRLGVRSVGLTWNWANAVADGALEPRGAGLTSFGRQVLDVMNQWNIWTDVSHLCERAFWDVIEIAKQPVATHSNCASITPHPRNLKDGQIRALIEADGVIAVTFVPHFLRTDGRATIDDVLRHVEHICSLGGENHLGFGSDFDGIDSPTLGLESYRYYDQLINQLQKYYSESQVVKFLYQNFVDRFPVEGLGV
jgi:membrane dipeptidase